MRLMRGEVITELVPDEAEYNDLEFIKLVLRRGYPIFLFQTTVTKLYSRRFIDNSGILFDEEAIRSEDCVFNTELLPYIRSVKTINSIGYTYYQDNSYISKLKPSYNKIYQSIRVGNVTSKIRFDTIKKYHLENETGIDEGFQKAVCIIYISNAGEIETGGFNDDEKQRLYDSFFSVMDYPIDSAIDDFEGTDKKIALFCAQKNSKAISRIYRLRRLKKKILYVLRG